MRAINVKVFDGRSVYSHRKCIRLDLSLDGYERITSNWIDGFNERLLALIPELQQHKCSLMEKMGFFKILMEGTYLHHICGHMAVALQNKIGLDVSFCSERKLGSNSYCTIYEYKYKNTGIEAGKIAIDIINSLIEKKDVIISEKLYKLKEILTEELHELEIKNDLREAEPRSIPILAVTGTNGKTTTTRLISYVMAKAGFKVGSTTTDGIYINGKCVFEGDTTGPRSAAVVLANNEVEVAVLETARGGMIRDGLAYDLADIAVITNITDDHLGVDGINTIEELAKVKALVGEAVKADGWVVINGDDIVSISILNRIKSNLIVFSQDKNNEVLAESIKKGGYGVYIDNDNLCIENQRSFLSIMRVKDIAITLKGALKYNIQNAMAACAALIGFGVEPSVIKEGFETFKCNEELNPGRFNSFDVNGILTILDYGHNIEGYKSVIEGLMNIEHNKLIGVIGVPGDRLDRTTLEVGRISGSVFDRIFIKEDKDRRGREPGEIAELLKKGVLDSGFNIGNLDIILDERDALEAAIDSANKGDIVIIFFEDYSPLLNLVKEKMDMKVAEDVLPTVV